MKKMKTLSRVIAVSMILSLTCSGYAYGIQIGNGTEDALHQPISNISETVYEENVSNSLEQFALIQQEKKSSNLEDYDAYIDDNGVLNIMVCDDTNNQVPIGAEITSVSTKSLRAYESVLSDDNDGSANVIYRKVKFSKSYLRDIQSALTEHMDAYDILVVGSGDMKNQVKIVMKDPAKQGDVLALLNNTIADFDSAAVAFEFSQEFVQEAQRSYPGRTVYWSDSLGTHIGTSGFNAKDTKTGKYGIVTAAHVAVKNKTLYNTLDTAIGQSTHWQNEKSMDAAFVPFNSGFSPSMAIDGDTNNRIKEYIKVADIVKGMPVGKFGQTTGRTTGKVQDAYANVGSYTRMLLCSYSSDNGDSGGPIFLSSAYGDYQKNALLGIHNGRAGSYAYATKAGYIIASYDLELYAG